MVRGERFLTGTRAWRMRILGADPELQQEDIGGQGRAFLAEGQLQVPGEAERPGGDYMT